MHFSTRRLLLIGFTIWLFALTLSAQCPVMPAGYICLTQQAANNAAENARELVATKDLVAQLEAKIKVQDINIAEIRATSKTNESQLLERLIKVQTDLGFQLGRAAELQNANIALTADKNVLVNKIQKKCLPFSICF